MPTPQPIAWLTPLRLIDIWEDTTLADDEFYQDGDLDFECDGELLRCPDGMKTDGGSIPPFVQAMLHCERWERPGRWGYLVHDCCYKRRLMVRVDGIWRNRECTKGWSDDLMYRIHGERGMGLMTRKAIWQGVHTFGGWAWRNGGRRDTMAAQALRMAMGSS